MDIAQLASVEQIEAALSKIIPADSYSDVTIEAREAVRNNLVALIDSMRADLGGRKWR